MTSARGRNLRDVQAGDRIGEYILREILGEGGFGVVWKAENPDLPGKVVAIKLARTQEGVAFLKSEGEVQHKLRHPGIVRTLSLNLSHSPPYVVREYVPGPTLRQYLDKKAPLAEEKIEAIFAGVLEALAYAHDRGVPHGDLSPANVLLDDRRGPRLFDFGLSVERGGPRDSVALSTSAEPTNVENVRGTLAYLAPERRSGGAPSSQADVFAVGVLLVEMATKDPLYLRFPIQGLSSRLSRIAERATLQDPGARFSSAREMLTSLRAPEELTQDEGSDPGAIRAEADKSVAPAPGSAVSVQTSNAELPSLLRRFAFAGSLAMLVAAAVCAAMLVTRSRRHASTSMTPVMTPTPNHKSGDARLERVRQREEQVAEAQRQGWRQFAIVNARLLPSRTQDSSGSERRIRYWIEVENCGFELLTIKSECFWVDAGRVTSPNSSGLSWATDRIEEQTLSPGGRIEGTVTFDVPRSWKDEELSLHLRGRAEETISEREREAPEHVKLSDLVGPHRREVPIRCIYGVAISE